MLLRSSLPTTPSDGWAALVDSRETVETVLALMVNSSYSWESDPGIEKALLVAVSNSHPEILDLVIKSAPDGPNRGCQANLDAGANIGRTAPGGDCSAMHVATTAAVIVNQVCGPWGTAIGAACQRSSSDALKLLLDEYGADAPLSDWAGRLPVHLTASMQLDSLQYLLDRGPKHGTDSTGRTVLQWAVQSGRVDAVKLALSQPGVDVDKTDEDGWTALCWAAREASAGDQCQVIELLLECGAKRSVKVGGLKTDQQWTPHGLPTTVVELLGEQPKSNQEVKSKRGHRHNGTRCDCCLMCGVIGTRYKCSSCDIRTFNLCFKCHKHRKRIHENTPSHEFETIGPCFDEASSGSDSEFDRDSFL
ncbi:hypothetical protein CDD81_8145 [Ophiocordyceps australis]|uniref:ZZ-type domain-containing protein n=1 Tax=Ophiocordyceps australis TaxID=1399860 RepID=A0A2C5Y3N2_9HYPO|nr:hypothetical protein CDD81_8145 [Ophiocordyceps australis]